MSTFRTVPDKCEVKGVIGKFGPETKCEFSPKRRVSVEGLSPIYCCNSHGKEMEKFWKPYHDVTNEAI